MVHMSHLWDGVGYDQRMDLSSPVSDIVPGVRGAVLAALARLTEPRTGRQIARLAGEAPSSTARVLDDLVDSGLVLLVVGGRDNGYALNREHVAAPAIVALSTLRGELIARLRKYRGRLPADFKWDRLEANERS